MAPDGDAAFTGHDHAVDAKTRGFYLAGETKLAQQRESAWIHGVAAQFVARKCGAIDNPDARARTGENGRRYGAPGAGAGDQDVVDFAASRGHDQ